MSKSIKHNGTFCEEEVCQYQKTCANHESAGDFRMEGGFSPQLWYKKALFAEVPYKEGDRELICESIDFESDNDPYRPEPKNRIGLQGYLDDKDVPEEFEMTATKYLEAMGEEKVKKQLHDFLDECLESNNQSGSFEIKGIDLDKRKLLVEFDIVVVPEDGYVGFQGY